MYRKNPLLNTPGFGRNGPKFPQQDYDSSPPVSRKVVVESHIQPDTPGFEPRMNFDPDTSFNTNRNPGFNELSQPSTLENPFNRISENIPTSAQKGKTRNSLFSDIEMKSFPSKSKQSKAVGFHDYRSSGLSSTSFKEYDPLTLSDLSKLPELTLETITDCIEKRYNHDLIYVSTVLCSST